MNDQRDEVPHGRREATRQAELEADARAAVIRACRHLSAAGLSPGTSGNISVRVGSRIIATPTGSSLRSVTAEELAVIPSDQERSPRPTKELPLHAAMYAAHPAATAVVHLHSPHATAIACLPPDEHGFGALPPLTPYRVMRLGDVPVVPYAAPGSAELASGVATSTISVSVIGGMPSLGPSTRCSGRIATSGRMLTPSPADTAA